MAKIKKRAYIVTIILAVFLTCISLVALSGCELLSGNATTYMNINEDGSGERIISCTTTVNDINKKVVGGEVALDNFLSENCPEQFSYTKNSNAYTVTYDFTLAFNNPSEYISKTNALLLKSSDTKFNVPNSVFVNGIDLEESFTSEDLMVWLSNGLYQNGLINAGNYLWKYTDNYVVYEGQTFTASPKIKTLALDYQPVDRIDIDTYLNSEKKTLDRQVSFYISQDVYTDLGATLEPYMQSLVPVNAVSSWSSINTEHVFTISFSVTDQSQLCTNMNKILDNDQSHVKVSNNTTTVFSSAKDFTEYLDFSSFPSNSKGQTHIDYSFYTSETQGLSSAKIFDDSGWIKVNDYIKNNTFSITEDTDVLHLSLTEGVECPVKAINMDTSISDSGSMQRNIEISFIDSDDNYAMLTKEFFESQKLEFVSVYTADDECIISLSGTPSEINSAQKDLLGDGNEITINEANEFNLYNQYMISDKINLSKFLSELGYEGDVSYTVTTPVELYSYSTQDDNSSEISSYNTNSKQITCVLPQSGISTITSYAKTINSTFVLVLTLITLIIIAILILIIYLILKNTRKSKSQNENIIEASNDPEFLYSGYKCPNCYTPLYLDMSYCPNCGIKIAFSNKKETKSQ